MTGKKQIFKVTWLDPAGFLDEKIKKPFKKLMAIRVNYGYIERDGDFILIISADIKEEKKKDFTIIHKALIEKLEKV